MYLRMTTRIAASTDSDFKRSLLESIKLSRSVEPDSISNLLTRCDRIDVEKGQVLLAPEAKNNSIYVVLSGQLQTRLGSIDSPTIADLKPGDCAGELSLVEDRDPSTYVVAVEDSHLMVISHEILWKMIDLSHEFAKNLLVVISDRVRSDSKFIAESIGTLRQAERNAVTDALTGLGNRHWMQDMFERELTRSRTDHGELCVMMIDVDRFKEINDEYGHIIGDQIAFFGRRRADVASIVGQRDMHGVRIGLGMDGQRLKPEGAAALDDTAGDFAAVGDQNFLHGYLFNVAMAARSRPARRGSPWPLRRRRGYRNGRRWIGI